MTQPDSRLPEPVDSRGDDRLPVQIDAIRGIGRIVVGRDDRLEAEDPGGRVPGQHLVAIANRLDRPLAVLRPDERPRTEAREWTWTRSRPGPRSRWSTIGGWGTTLTGTSST